MPSVSNCSFSCLISQAGSQETSALARLTSALLLYCRVNSCPKCLLSSPTPYNTLLTSSPTNPIFNFRLCLKIYLLCDPSSPLFLELSPLLPMWCVCYSSVLQVWSCRSDLPPPRAEAGSYTSFTTPKALNIRDCFPMNTCISHHSEAQK